MTPEIIGPEGAVPTVWVAGWVPKEEAEPPAS